MSTQTRRIHFACYLMLFSLLPGIAWTDQLVMDNGDVITGDVKKVEDGKVFIKPAYGSEISVDIGAVVSIDAETVFEFKLEDGSTLTGQFAGTAGENEQILLVEGEELTFETIQLAQALPPQKHYERASKVEANLTFNDGNTDSKNNLIYADTRVRVGEHRHFADLTFRRDETDGVSTKKQDLIRYTYNWMFNEPWYMGVSASYERDPIKDLNHRYNIGLLLGRDIFKDSRKFLTISGGLGWMQEKISGVSDNGTIGLWNLVYEHDFRDGTLAFFHNHGLNYQFYGDNNLIIKSNTGFRFDIYKNIYASVSLRYDYETEPAAGAENHDTTLAVGVGAKF